MNIQHKVYKTSLMVLLAGVSLSSFADPTCAELMTTGGEPSVTSAIASEYSTTLLSTVNGCLATYCASQSSPTQCQTNLTIATYAVTYVSALQGYTPNTFTPTPNPNSSSSAALPPQAPPSLPQPTTRQDNNTSTAPGYVPTPQLSNNNANNSSNTNSNNNNISNNTRSYIRWY